MRKIPFQRSLTRLILTPSLNRGAVKKGPHVRRKPVRASRVRHAKTRREDIDTSGRGRRQCCGLGARSNKPVSLSSARDGNLLLLAGRRHNEDTCGNGADRARILRAPSSRRTPRIRERERKDPAFPSPIRLQHDFETPHESSACRLEAIGGRPGVLYRDRH